MKLSKTSWIALGIGIFVIAAFNLFQTYQSGVEERDEAQNSLTETQTALIVVNADKDRAEVNLTQTEEELAQIQNELSQLETELAQAELTLDQAEAKFPVSVESIEYDELLFRLAEDANLEIISLTASRATETDKNDIAYAVTAFTMNVQGEVENILDFINRIVTEEDLNTADLKSVTVTIPKPLSGNSPSATINLVVYSYQEDQENQEDLEE